MAGWAVFEIMPNIKKTESRQHVVPVDDVHEHDLTLNCWCKPKVDDGVVIHNSFDGRELFERGEGWRYPT